ncbi:hypothetical protein CRG98_021649, partial [Punica granatum]
WRHAGQHNTVLNGGGIAREFSSPTEWLWRCDWSRDSWGLSSYKTSYVRWFVIAERLLVRAGVSARVAVQRVDSHRGGT